MPYYEANVLCICPHLLKSYISIRQSIFRRCGAPPVVAHPFPKCQHRRTTSEFITLAMQIQRTTNGVFVKLQSFLEEILFSTFSTIDYIYLLYCSLFEAGMLAYAWLPSESWQVRNSAGSPQTVLGGRYAYVRRCGGRSMVLPQLGDPIGCSGFLSRHDKTLAVESHVNIHTFLASFIETADTAILHLAAGSPAPTYAYLGLG